MLLTLRSTQTLTAVLSGAAATTNPTYSIDTVDLNLNASPATSVGSLTGATAVTLASAPLQVRSLTICNIDTAAVTVTLKETVSAKTIVSMTLAVGDMLVIDDSGINVIDVNGNVQSSAVASSVDLADDADIVLGTDDDALIRFSAGDVSNPSLVVALDNTSQALHITDKGAVATDWNLSADTHPTVYVHSNTTPTTDYLKVGAHDGTTALIDVVGGTTLAIKAAGNEIVELVQTASATNGLKITSTATGDPVRIGANGTGATANRGMILDDSNGNESIIMVGTASAVNEITVTNNAAGSAPIISATGGDTDINLSLTPKGAGAVVATAGFVAKSSSAAAITTTRSLTIADSGGVFSVAKTSAYAITLPTPAQGLDFTFMVLDTGANIVTISNGSAHLYGQVSINDVSTVMTGTTVGLASGGAIGDWVRFQGIDATHYLVTGACLDATDITIA